MTFRVLVPPLRINRGSPLAVGLQVCVFPIPILPLADLYFDAQRSTTVSGTQTQGWLQYKGILIPAQVFGSSDTIRFVNNNPPIKPGGCATGTSDYTVACISNIASGAGSCPIMSQATLGETNSFRFYLNVKTSGGLAGSAGQFSILEYNSPTVGNFADGPSTSCDGNPHLFAASRDQNKNYKVYRDGVDVTSASSSTSSALDISGSTQGLYLNSLAGTNSGAANTASLFLAWGRGLSGPEHLLLGQHPESLFL